MHLRFCDPRRNQVSPIGSLSETCIITESFAFDRNILIVSKETGAPSFHDALLAFGKAGFGFGPN